MRTKKLNLPHKEGGGEFTVTLDFKRGNIEEKSVTDWDTVTVQRSTLAAQQAPSFVTLRKTRLNLSLMDIEQ